MFIESEIREKTAFTVKGGQVVFADRQAANQLLKALADGEYYLLPKRKTNKRTPHQNAALWRLYTAISDWCNTNEAFMDEATAQAIDVTPDLIHALCKHKFRHLLPKRTVINMQTGEAFETEITTTELLRHASEGKVFSDYYEAILEWAGEYTNYTLNF